MTPPSIVLSVVGALLLGSVLYGDGHAIPELAGLVATAAAGPAWLLAAALCRQEEAARRAVHARSALLASRRID
ncbi:hypothetical protein [Acuticoccus yangtzensis]|uniref:hypothetical protein n=1 Tax=Acuticoccus yangtzensis TaxID=1443441 RepID=UPI0009F7F033|nr:hypothetical protein [Acuticoccus yangtzensis]ORE92190.1 hypothetical protein ATO13_17709 [Stappia sp. 22II-S9-Z10]